MAGKKRSKSHASKGIKDGSGLTQKQKRFCEEYIYDWNATRSYTVAYPNIKNANSAGVNASRLLRNAKIQQFVKELQDDIEKTVGISKIKVLSELNKLAFSSIAHLHNTWIERKAFDELTDDQKACISEISTSVRKQTIDERVIDVEYIKIKLYDKHKALDSISKMLGFESPQKMELTGKDGKDLIPKTIGPIPIVITTPEQQAKLDEEINSDSNSPDNA